MRTENTIVLTTYIKDALTLLINKKLKVTKYFQHIMINSVINDDGIKYDTYK